MKPRSDRTSRQAISTQTCRANVKDNPFTKEEPQFQHDCDSCTFLGQYNECHPGWGQAFDLYIHVNPSGMHCLMARYGNNGWEYYSWDLVTPSHNPAIQECKRRVYALSADLLARAHYKLMDSTQFWYDKDAREADAFLVKNGSDLRLKAAEL